jgi:addiction module RelB/DinJ family antitoxin
MAQSELTVRIDDDLRASGETLFRSLGISFSTAVAVFVSHSVKQGRIPFDVGEMEPEGFEHSPETEADDPFFNRATQAEMVRRIKDGEARGGTAFVDYETLKKRRADAQG